MVDAQEPTIFYPPNRNGFIFHIAAITVLTITGLAGLWQAVNTGLGGAFILYLSPFLVAVPLVPYLIYRLNNLENASYSLGRDAIRLQWGLRVEVIPMPNVQWVRPATDMGRSVRLPRVRWPGAVLGARNLPGGGTQMEFMASRTAHMLVIATPERLFAISPANPDEFLQTYQYLTELGSLLSPAAESRYPARVLTGLWRERYARYLLLSGGLLSLGLLIWVGLSISRIDQISLGFLPTGEPREPIASIRLLLLPILNSFIFLANLLLGITLFRRERLQPLAYLLWVNSVVVALGFLAAVYFILQTAP